VADILLSWGSRGGSRTTTSVSSLSSWKGQSCGGGGSVALMGKGEDGFGRAISRAWRRMFILSRSSTMRPLSACSLMLML
jgi:hypothetical protein